ncbi:hypothetical protein [Croceivirga sp. JEA036]|uniref:hypothetical protein n=1 Tax=Croceivirga sp. JEA036 TaxID=2721162 RepID=UPI001439A110|nr:hypothetical protein [Croceivirga sp. JEA036]NJB35315.1 hypothetical protein [Croceivirga sp. JEA036]
MSHDNNSNWVSSKEAQRHFKIKGCDLMHHRVSGKLTFQKKGNTYLYLVADLDKLKSPFKEGASLNSKTKSS